jgi:DNA-binding NarL/FixJ family response regulator
MRTRFLIVDDNELVRQSLRTALQANPEWEIAGEASNGQEGVEVFQTSRPNLVILDFQMPGMNGIETARRILEIAPAMPIVLFTQHASPELEKHALSAGIRSVVSKTDTFPMVGIIEALLGPNESPAANKQKDK